MAEEDKSKGQTISPAQAATFLSRSPSWVQALVSQGYISRQSYGRYSVVAIVRGALAYYEDLLQKSNKAAAASRATDARTREIELRIAERRRDLIPIEDAKAEIAAVVSEVRAEIAGLGARITRDMELRRRIDGEADGILGRLAERAAEAGRALAAEGGTVEAEPEA